MLTAAFGQPPTPPAVDGRWAFYGLLVTTLATLVAQLYAQRRSTVSRREHHETLAEVADRTSIVALRLDEHIATSGGPAHVDRRRAVAPVPHDRRRKGTP